MTPKRPTLPEGTDPVEALRQLQQQLAEAPWPDREKEGGLAAGIAYSDGLQEGARTAGNDLAPIVDAVEALVDSLREQLRDVDPFDGPGATAPDWYGSVWMCPVDDCKWAHREENAVSSTDPVAAERVRTALVGHLGDHGSQQPHEGIVNALAARVFDWPAHCSEWIAGSDPENPEPCPEYASPGSDKCALHDPRQVEYAADLMARQGWLSPSQAAELRATAHRLTVEAFVRPQDEILGAVPSPTEEEYHGHVLNARTARNLLHGGSPEAQPEHDIRDHVDTGQMDLADCPGYRPHCDRERCNRCGHCGWARSRHPQAKPRARVAYPPAGTGWRHGFPGAGTATTWRCQRCGTNHEGNPPRCLHCGHTVLDPGHWVALPGGTG